MARLDDNFEGDAIFIELDGKRIPYFIEDMRQIGTGHVIKFEAIDDLEKGRRFAGSQLFVEKSRFKESTRTSTEDQLKGVTIYDQKNAKVGKVEDVTDNAGQLLLTLDDETLIPFHTDLVLEWDAKNGKLKMQLPNGLTTL